MGRNGTGVVAASETSIEITFTYRGKRCRERLKLAPTPANMKRAAQHRAAILDAIQKQTFEYRVTFPDSPRAAYFAERKGEILTVEKYLDSWLDAQRSHLKASTYDGYRKVVNNHLIPAFGTTKLSDLNRKTIKDWCSSQQTSLKAIKNRLSVLRSALNLAAQDELIDTNPLYGWQWKSRAVVKTEDDVDPFSANEQQQILSCMEGQDRNMFKFAFWTGLRTSELIAIEWSDIDWHRKTIQVRRALTRAAIANKSDAEPPKTRAGKRDVKLLTPALEALEGQKAHTLGKTDFIFTNPRTGKRWSGDLVVRSAWKRAIDAAKVRYRRPYQTRHTYASMMLTAGESPMWVAQQMGHSDWTMIARVYGRWVKDAQPDAGSKAVQMFSR
ncbi:tyrosine-type recombinase/integrase [Herbaspirillum rubrisubalbicans]|uniref:Site-specific integrase n=1 Tax=Herbaspirillum rubrisubalbicans Os34 TaxID=1235827 RepID=A0A6M3ZNG2_9BURK|nr:site-specific integrase [Herbaspirillum rubrisubalbicans]QJQ00164.1 site-specific integrase [Herbaspirillum rubrisubalbicans Os34]